MKIELKNISEDVLRSCILNLYVKDSTISLLDNTSIEVVLKIYHYKFFKNICIQILCIVKVVPKSYSLKSC